MKILINAFININNITKEEALEEALKMVEIKDLQNNKRFELGVVTKLYYITPELDNLLVLVSENGATELQVSTQILLDTPLKDYPVVKLPAQIIEYKEVIIKKNHNLPFDDMMNIAQVRVEELSVTSFPHKLAIVKVINYNDMKSESQLVMPKVFGNGFKSSDIQISTSGDSEKGSFTAEDIAVDKVLIKLKKDFKKELNNLPHFYHDKSDFVVDRKKTLYIQRKAMAAERKKLQEAQDNKDDNGIKTAKYWIEEIRKIISKISKELDNNNKLRKEVPIKRKKIEDKYNKLIKERENPTIDIKTIKLNNQLRLLLTSLEKLEKSNFDLYTAFGKAESKYLLKSIQTQKISEELLVIKKELDGDPEKEDIKIKFTKIQEALKTSLDEDLLLKKVRDINKEKLNTSITSIEVRSKQLQNRIKEIKDQLKK